MQQGAYICNNEMNIILPTWQSNVDFNSTFDVNYFTGFWFKTKACSMFCPYIQYSFHGSFRTFVKEHRIETQDEEVSGVECEKTEKE